MGADLTNMGGKHVLLGVVCAALAMASTAGEAQKNPAMCAPEGDLDCESPCKGNRNSAVGTAVPTMVKYPLIGQPYKKAHKQCKDSKWTKTLMFWTHDRGNGRCVCRRFDNDDPMSTSMVAATGTKE